VVDEFSFFVANHNRIANNSIYSNGALGIDLEGDGPTPNDAMDKDTGPNTLQNKPNLTSATTTGTRITVKGTLGSKPNRTFTIRYFANRASEPRGYEGRTFLGLGSVKTDANGEATFTKVLRKEVRADQRITATATGPAHNTSEFSAPQKVVQQ
jgi:protocatechuate 3,4-dioxygenase beta subunit